MPRKKDSLDFIPEPFVVEEPAPAAVEIKSPTPPSFSPVVEPAYSPTYPNVEPIPEPEEEPEEVRNSTERRF